jgi:dienelactone hydrolase
MKKFLKLCVLFISLVFTSQALSKPLFHEKRYPKGDGPFPAVILLHTSGGFYTVLNQLKPYTQRGYAAYAPDFFTRHKITKANRFDTWTKYRGDIEKELVEIVEVMKNDPKVDKNNIFAAGFSNGGYWATFLAGRNHVNAGASHYGVWWWGWGTWHGYPVKYLSKDSNPVLALHGLKETVSKWEHTMPQFSAAEWASPKFKKVLFPNVGHSWDCKLCKEDGYNAEVTQKALDLTIEFFEQNKK